VLGGTPDHCRRSEQTVWWWSSPSRKPLAVVSPDSDQRLILSRRSSIP